MAIQLKLYRITEDPRVLDKYLKDSGTGQNRITNVDAVFKEGRNYMNPVIVLRNPANTTRQIEECNYIHDTGNNRYYFVDELVVKPNRIFEYHCHLDVLKTYAAQLKALTVTLERSETVNNGYLPDSEYTALGYRAIVAKKFPQGLKPVFDHIRAKGMRPGLWLSLAWVGASAAPLGEHRVPQPVHLSGSVPKGTVKIENNRRRHILSPFFSRRSRKGNRSGVLHNINRIHRFT